MCEILGVVVNILNANDKYPVPDCKNLLLQIQRQLSEKRKPFSEFFFAPPKYTSNFKHFEEKGDRYSSCFSKITHCERLG